VKTGQRNYRCVTQIGQFTAQYSAARRRWRWCQCRVYRPRRQVCYQRLHETFSTADWRWLSVRTVSRRRL